MKTYQDLIALGEDNVKRKEFILAAINEHTASRIYLEAADAENYSEARNTTIMQFKRLLYTMRGEAVPDNFSANHKAPSNFYDFIIEQENQYLLGNGAVFSKADTKDKIGGSKFDNQLQQLGYEALKAGVAFGFFNLDTVDVFKVTEFVPIYDEEDGAMKAGIRFWQIAPNKPQRITLYELDGYTDYIKRTDEDMTILNEKSSYIIKTEKTEADGVIYTQGENYPAFPIIPLWANKHHQSSLIPIKSGIDIYDLIKSGFANDLDDCSQIYWILQNAGGMDQLDLAEFRDRIKTTHIASVQDGVTAESHTTEVPYAAREAFLTRCEVDIFRDARALNVKEIASGAITATQIRAAYEPLNSKTDDFEYQVLQFIEKLLALAGVEDVPTFSRSQIVNQSELVTMIMECAPYLDDETVVELLPFLTPEQKANVKKAVKNGEIQRFSNSVVNVTDEE